MIRNLTARKPCFRLFRAGRLYGRGPVEIIVVVGIVGFAMLLIMVALPRGRETARMAKCQQNLMQIGVGLQMYHVAQRHYPTVPHLDGSAGDPPIAALLDAFVVPDLLELKDPTKPPKPTQAPPRGSRVPGLACPSDSHSIGGLSVPSISYRANTGETASGTGGPFEPGRTSTSRGIEQADGLSFTAAYAERLVGDRQPNSIASWNYGTVPGTVVGSTCPEIPADRWNGDAGADWSEASWRSTLYSHALSPNPPRSCIGDDGRTALMGASSSHVNRINVLMMDGSLKGITPGVDPKVWQGLGTIGPTEAKEGP